MQSHATKSSNFPNHPLLILSFIKHVLATAVSPSRTLPEQKARQKMAGLRLEDLRIVPDGETEGSFGSENSDNDETTGMAAADREMLDTAINLLLAVLEGRATNIIMSDATMFHFTPQQIQICLRGQHLS